MKAFWVGCAVLFLLPVVMPRGKWLLWSSVTIGALMAAVWIPHIYVTSRPEHTGSLNSSVGEALMAYFTAIWFLGLVVRYIFWLFQLKREEIIEKRQASSRQRNT